jgi:hypothetical protein
MELKLKLTRKWLTENSTIGELTVDGKFECFIIEDNYPTPYKKIPGKTAIPAGRYQVIVNLSNRFKVDMPLVCNVPEYQGIRIHPGNTSADTEGCLLPGRRRKVDKVLESKLAYEALFTKLKQAIADGKKIFIEIVVEPES